MREMEGGIVVGILSYEDGQTVPAVGAAVRDGLDRLPAVPRRIVFADCGSTDDTLDRARDALGDEMQVLDLSPRASPRELFDVPYHGMPGKARALQAVLSAASDLGARACVVLDAGVRTIEPGWIEALARPVLDDACDLVSPHYVRHPFEGTITKGIMYPVIRALFGVRLRQPAAAEFACSAAVIGHLLEEDLWERDGVQTGVDVWLTLATVAGGFRVGETELGLRAHNPHGERALDVATTVAQVVGALFADLERRAGEWQRRQAPGSVRRFGGTSIAPAGVSIDVEPLIESCRLGLRELQDLWTWVLPPRTLFDLRGVVTAPADRFRIEDDLWARIVYDFAVGYRLRVLARDHLLRSLTPLYAGWLASYVLQVRERPEAADERIEALAAAFEAQKPYLISRWRWPERLRTA
jgi:hypothetical protein